ncbi:MAG: molecular chaperone [Rickettsiales bacterium]|nr:molecular chaperone [Rickettsiales bacterium]|tara:strand:+ start:142 stop:1020 length:879 start_codon:yes stop_codon:yes gene_type:complete
MSDQLTPFLLENAPIRGRIVRLHDAVSEILNTHRYPDRIAHLLGEALVLAAILSANVKGEGIVTVQVQSKGPLKYLVADATAKGHLRGYADFDAEAIEDEMPLDALCPAGVLAITLDDGQRYQGIVELQGTGLSEAIEAYFTQSQQLELKSHFAVVAKANESSARKWQAAGMVIEHMPSTEGVTQDPALWEEAGMLFHTLTDPELLDTGLPMDDLLYRLFHEHGVRVYEPQAFKARCRCSKERIEGALQGMPDADKLAMLEDGNVEIDCQFCHAHYGFTAAELGLAAGDTSH